MARRYFIQPPTASIRFLAVLGLALYLASFHSVAHGQDAIVVNAGTKVTKLSQNAVRSIFGMRLRNWPDQQPIQVFVLPDQHPVHQRFAKQVLNIFPNQLRRAWDRLVYSGTGQAPTQVKDEQEMHDSITNTPGAIGYLPEEVLSDGLNTVEVE